MTGYRGLQTADGMARGARAHANNVSAAYRLECMSSRWQLNSYEADFNESIILYSHDLI